MTSITTQQHSFPVVPQSLSAGDHEMRDYPLQNESRPTLYQAPYPKPYLGLRARLSQIWINRWTILLLLILVRLLFSIASTNSSVASARQEALSACTSVEKLGSSMASMPHFMAKGINDMTATGVEKGVGALMSMLDLSVTAVEEIVLFVIHMLTSTYLCLITLAVSGSIAAAAELGKAVAQSLNQTIDEVTNGIGNGVKDLTDGMNSILDKIKNIPFAGSGFNSPQINLDDEINKLKSLQVPSEVSDKLDDLKNNLPTFEEVQNFTDNVIRFPFQEVRQLIGGLANFTFDRDILPIPQKEQLTFCSEGNAINDFFDDLITMGLKARKIAVIVLVLLAVLACIPMGYMEIRRYRRMSQRAALCREGHSPMDVVYLASRPTSAGIGLWLGKRFGSSHRQAAMRWGWSYGTSTPMLFLLSLGLAGLFSCFCQYLVLRSIQNKAPELTSQVADFTEQVVVSLNNASMSWSQGINSAMGKLDNEINDDIFGWVNTTTGAVNDTLNAFVDKMGETLNSTFGETILYEPIKDVLNCLIGLKIAGIQKGLTWVSEHTHVSFPAVSNDTLSLGALARVSDSQSANELLADPSGKAQDEVTEAVNHVIEKLYSTVRTEALISMTLMLIWFTIALVGLLYAFTQLRHKDRHASNPYVADPVVDQRRTAKDYPVDLSPPSYEYPINKVAPYTLQPRPFRAYESTDNGAIDENYGRVDAHTASARPGHARTSSHVQLAGPSPLDKKHNPFHTANEFHGISSHVPRHPYEKSPFVG